MRLSVSVRQRLASFLALISDMVADMFRRQAANLCGNESDYLVISQSVFTILRFKDVAFRDSMFSELYGYHIFKLEERGFQLCLRK